MHRYLGIFVLLLSCLFYWAGISFVYAKRTSLPRIAIKKIDVFSSSNKLQVVLKTTGDFSYKYFLLPVKRSPKKLLVIDIWPAYLPQVRKVVPVNDPQVKRVKVSQYNKKTVRVVVQLAKLLPYHPRKGKNKLILSIDRSKPQRKKKVKVCIQDVKIAYPPPQGLELIIKMTGEPYHKDFFLPGILLRQLPPRLVIDLWPAYLPKKRAKEEIKVTHSLVSQLRLAQFNKQTVRIVLSLKTEKIPYSIKFQKNNLILTAFVTTVPEKTPISLTTALGLKIGRIVIDPGHGGKDPGAIGYRGLREKDVTLRLAKLLEKKLKARHECQIILTRYKDEYVALKKRVALANKVKADLFISLHCNACPNHRLQGTETYFLGLTHDRYALAVAARENASLKMRRGELDKILFDLLAKAKIKESSYLAARIQENLVRHLRSKKYNPVTNLGVKQAPFYVLIGTAMPAVLVETAFIDHFREGRHLRDPNYLNAVAEGILKGVESYIHMIEPYKYSPMEAGKGG